MTICSACGNEFPEGARFCNHCGRNFASGAPGAAASTQAPPPPYAWQAPVYGPPYPAYVPRKSVALAIVLTIFFGPLGMFYTTVEGALIMCVVMFFATFTGIGLLIAWPACVIWAAMAADNHNKRFFYTAAMRPGYPA